MKKNNQLIINYFTNYFTNVFRIFICVAAFCIAYKCNKRSKKHNKYLMLVIAFIVPEIYLSQAFIRYYVLKDYKC
jgi:hypothetical protein